MAHLKQTRKGWENEHLATYLLSRVAFVARPITVADDIGTDLYCTLFEILRDDGEEYLFPRSSIAVQVKSGSQPVDVSNKGPYFKHLNIPYYLGVLDRDRNTLALHSARFLPHLRAFKGWPRRLRFVPVQYLDGASYMMGEDTNGGRYDLYCPLVTTLLVSDDETKQRLAIESLLKDSREAIKAIVSERNGEFIFDVPRGVQIFAGDTSAAVFRENFLKRLAEVFYNLQRLLSKGIQVDQREIDDFMNFYEVLKKRIDPPEYLKQRAESLKAYVERSRSLTSDAASGAAIA